MKKYILFVLALALIFSGAGLSFAANGPSNPNAQWIGGNGQNNEPPCEFVRVRYGRVNPLTTDPTLASGTVVVWDTNSADGVTVSACMAANIASERPVGVLITPLLTDDTNGFQENDRSFGYMAVRGYTLALVDTSESTTGKGLVASSAVDGYFGTGDGVTGGTQISQDCGILLTDTAADGMMRVWLK